MSRSARSHASCGEAASSACSVLMWVKCTGPTSTEYHGDVREAGAGMTKRREYTRRHSPPESKLDVFHAEPEPGLRVAEGC